MFNSKVHRQSNNATEDSRWKRQLSPLGTLLVLLLAGSSAQADTLVAGPVGTAKKRNIEKVSASLVEPMGETEGLRWSEESIEPGCAQDVACLAELGKKEAATRVVGIHVARPKKDFVVTLVAVDVATGAELGREEHAVKRRKLESDPASRLLQFLMLLPEAAPSAAPPVDPPASPPADEPAADAPAEETLAPEIEEPGSEPSQPEALGESDAVAEPELSIEAGPTEPVADDESGPGYAVELGLSTGVVLPQLASELSTAAGVELDVGVPVWSALSLVAAASYSQPTVDSSLDDPRLGGQMYTTETTQRELMVTLGATWRFLPLRSRLNAYAGLGARVWMLETLTNGESGGMSFGENQERSTRYGAAGWAGAEYLLGPGALAAELDLGGSDLPHLVTGDVATTSLGLQLGYRLRF